MEWIDGDKALGRDDCDPDAGPDAPTLYLLLCFSLQSTSTPQETIPSLSMAINFQDFAGQSRTVVSDDARTASFDEIPIIDLAPFLKQGATEAERMKVVHEVRDACRKVGFLYIK